ncbi:glycosyltransferase family 2 protein [Mycobacterium sp. 1274761.0]|uniref:glycosyltransferase family 2 protein n=1 Tax=Mycobacterium sp. 1274761.0 TaxID=1834077 RepID=UPI0007FF1C86|nr:glycosyltransferase [Mycobacterium sp. 1274761.0]OBK73272.1 transferase [Mycobacterium sp. 1274761.0]
MAGATRTSFVIASRNRAAELSTTITRLLNTTNCRIIAVDNGSEDDSVAVVRRFAHQSAGRVSAIELKSNRGVVARNVGVAAATTPIIAFCDDDSWWEPSAITNAEDLFDRHPTLGLLAARTVVMPHRHDDPMVSVLADSALGRRRDLPGPSILGFMTCAAVVRKAAFVAAGGFSELLHFYGEEQLLALDLAAVGWDLCYCPQLTAYHQPSEIRGSSSARQARELRNAVLTTWMRRPMWPCLRATGRLLRAAVRDADHARGALEALVRLPSVMKLRRPLPDEVERALALIESG